MRWFVIERSRVVTALVTLAASACNPEAVGHIETLTYCDIVECSRECASLEVVACDIADRRCQAMVQRSVECVRGIEFDRKPTVVLSFVDAGSGATSTTPDGGRANDAGRTNGEPPSADAGFRGESRAVPLVIGEGDLPGTAEVVAHHSTEALQALGLLSREMDIAAAWVKVDENVGGTYSAMEQVLDVVVWPERDAWREMGTLAHEMVHALQDQERDLVTWSAELLNQDTSVQAYRAFIEGEAELYQLLALHLMLKLPFSGERLEELARKLRKSLMHAIAEDDSPGIMSLQALVYPVGLGLLLERWLRDGNEGTDNLAEEFPQDLAAWMRQDEQSTRVRLSCKDNEALSDANLTQVMQANEQPTLLLPLLLTKKTLDDPLELARAWDATAAWRGDCMEVYGETFSPAAPYAGSSSPRLDAVAPTSTQADAGPDTSADAGIAPDGGSVAFPPVHLADVFVRWTMEFDDEATAKWVNTTLAEADWDIEAVSERQGRRVQLQVGSQGEHGAQSPLVDCWPLYPFDPNDVYVMGDGISHWQHPEVALGSTRRSSSAAIRSDGELLLSDKYLITPDWCQLPGEQQRQWEDDEEVAERANDFLLPSPCEERAATAKLGVTGERLFSCERSSGDWVDGSGRRVVTSDIGQLVAVGHADTVLLETGVFHRGGIPDELTDVSSEDAGPWTDAGAARDELSESRQDFEEGTLFLFQGPSTTQTVASPFAQAEVAAARALLDGYWVVFSRDRALFYVDFYGRAERIIDYDTRVSGSLGSLGSEKLDAFGTLFRLAGISATRTLTVFDVDGHVAQYPVPRSEETLRLVTGP
jgi:hypothetical protein